MDEMLTPAQFKELQNIDSATVSNAIETFQVRPRVSGYAGLGVKCIFPEMDSMLGYAVTCTADSTTEDRPNPGLNKLWEAIEKAPKPAVLVIQDVRNKLSHSCHMGEVMVTTALSLGAVGCVTDAGLRDQAAVRELGFHYFCPGMVVSHGNAVICDIECDVVVDGMQVTPGDLVHGDVDGVLTIPHNISSRVAAAARKIQKEEEALMGMIREPGFTMEKLKKYQQGFQH